MTYVSRGSRLNVSRWLDECDAEYKLRACRKRSDGRLKRHISCDDLRAWVNSNCLQNEHFLDLMSNGESTGKSHVRLYGRYIPVPVLIKVFGSLNAESVQGEDKEGKGEKVDGVSSKGSKGRSALASGNKDGDGSNAADVEADETALWRAQCEKYVLEKRLFECRALLCKAVGKLEKIDGIVCCANEDSENARNAEIEMSFRLAKSVCNCSLGAGSESPKGKASTEANKCSQLMRKISSLQQKLKRNQDQRQEVKEQIRVQRSERRASGLQVTELYSCRDARIKRLQKRMEKLIAGRSKLLSELTDAVSCWSKMKKSASSSRNAYSRVSFEPQRKQAGHEDSSNVAEPVACECGCRCTDNVETSNSPSSEDEPEEGKDKEECSTPPRSRCNGTRSKGLDEYGNEARDNQSGNPIQGDNDNNKNWQSNPKVLKLRSANHNKSNISSAPDFSTATTTTTTTTNRTSPSTHTNPTIKEEKRSRIKFVCKGSGCGQTWEDSLIGSGTSSNNPTDETRSTNAAAYLVRATQTRTTVPAAGTGNGEDDPSGGIPERNIKSETAMEEIEKALRNYEQRLNCLGCLDRRVEQLRAELVRGHEDRAELLREREEGRRAREAERDKSNREAEKLCEEKRELRKQVEQLTAKLDVQGMIIRGLKCRKKELKVAECEAAELKKEISAYQSSCEDQRKCIKTLESVVANQRAEIEKLMNLIKKLTTPQGWHGKCGQEKNVQRSRSFSPVQNRRGPWRPSTAARLSCSSEEEDVAYSEESLRRGWQTGPKVCCSPGQCPRRRAW